MTAQPTWVEVTAESLRRALYIDFEGQKDKPPVLLGCATRAGTTSSPPAWQYADFIDAGSGSPGGESQVRADRYRRRWPVPRDRVATTRQVPGKSGVSPG